MRHLKTLMVAFALTAFMLPQSTTAADGPTLKTIKERGHLVCGVHQGRYGFASPDSKGVWRGLDVDYCHAVAAAVLGDRDKVKFIPLGSVQRFPALQSGEVDLLSRTTTWTLTRDVALGFNFSAPTYYTGTGLLVRKDLGVTKATELDGATVCIFPGSTTEKNISGFFRKHNMKYEPVVIENVKEMVGAYLLGRCDVFAADKSGLIGHRAYDTKNPDDHVILPGLLSKEPLAIGVRHGDDQWYDIIKWIVYATFEAEERGVSSENIESLKGSKDPHIQRLVGTSGDLGKKLGLDNEWAYRAIKQVGNYEEIHERNVGMKSPLKVARGVNSLWSDGGLLYAMPLK